MQKVLSYIAIGGIVGLVANGCADDSQDAVQVSSAHQTQENDKNLELTDYNGNVIYALNLAKSPISEAGGIQTKASSWCGRLCTGIFSGSFSIQKDVPIVLEAFPLSGYTFSRWEGPCESGSAGPVCNLKMSDTTADVQFKAVFAPIDPVNIAVTINSETTLGQIQAFRSELKCSKSVGAVCNTSLARGTTVVLQAMDQSNDTMFVGWDGLNCLRQVSSGRSHLCEIKLNSSLSFNAKFVKAAVLEASISGSGNPILNQIRLSNGSLFARYILNYNFLGGRDPKVGYPTSEILQESDISSLSWDKIQTDQYFAKIKFGSTVTITAAAQAGQRLEGWELDCALAGTNVNCGVTMDQNKMVRAKFSVPPPPPNCNYSTAQISAPYGSDINVSITPTSACIAKLLTLTVSPKCPHELVGSAITPEAPISEIAGSRATTSSATTIKYNIKGSEGVYLTAGNVIIKGTKKTGTPVRCNILGVKIQ